MTTLQTVLNNATKKVTTLKNIIEAVDTKHSNIIWNVGVKNGSTLLEGTFINNGETGEIEVNVWIGENGALTIDVELYDSQPYATIFRTEWEVIAFIQEVSAGVTGGASNKLLKKV